MVVTNLRNTWLCRILSPDILRGTNSPKVFAPVVTSRILQPTRFRFSRSNNQLHHLAYGHLFFKMADTAFASLNGTAMYAAQHDYYPDPATIARRSLSIFSRRGTETPEARPSFINQSTMARTPTKLLNERQRGWLRRKSFDSGKTGSSPKKTKGTILKAVPPAEIIRMTKLEEEMATSPNEEIVSAISERSPDILDFYTISREASPTQKTFATASPARGGWAQDSQSPRQRPGSARRRDSKDRIGIWVDGVVHWDPKTAIRNMVSEYREDLFEEETRFTPLRPAALNPRSNWRPTLTVTIPQSQPLISDMSLLADVEAQPPKPAPSVAPAEIVNKFPIAPSQVETTQFPSRDVSPLETATSKQPSQPDVTTDISEDDHATDSNAEEPTQRQHRSSSSTASSFTDHDESSTYSKRSSATSLDASQVPAVKDLAPAGLPSDSADAFSLVNPADAGVFDDARSMIHTANVNKPLPRVPTPRSMRPAPGPPSASGKTASSRPLRSTRSAPGSRKAGSIELRPMSAQALGSARSLSRLDLVDAEFMRSSPYTPATSDKAFDIESPTLSQAEEELEVHLSTISEDQKDETVADGTGAKVPETTESVTLGRSSSVRSVMQPPSRAPTLPKRSRKRDWRNTVQTNFIAPSQTLQLPAKSPIRRRSDPAMLRANADRDAMAEESAVCANVRRSASTLALQRVLSFAESGNASSAVADLSKSVGLGITLDDGLCVVSGPVIMRAAFNAAVTDVKTAAAAAKALAEDVLLKILGALTSFDDLFNTAVINKGMYRVFKENELDLIRAVAQNESAAGWEFREWCPPACTTAADDSSKASSQLEHSPTSYLSCHKRDLETIQQLKLLALGKCHTFIRRETAFALSTPSHPHAQRFTDAFWRIWAFCTIFGSQKGREDDITGQVDWLKGGLLANNQGFSATVNTNLEFDMGSVLLNAPDHFAQGNRGGLTAGQLYDMTKIWTCLATLLAPYQNCTLEASDHGVFEHCQIQQGDVEREEHMLEEWTAYLLSLGPAAVLEMAQLASDPSVGFAVAQENGWTQWTPPMYNNSRTTFLKEPVSRLYEERVAAAAQKLRNPREVEKKEMSRKRVANLAAEIRLARQSSAYKRLPLIDMNSERPMSMISRRSTANTVRSIASARASMVVAPPLHMHPAFAQSPVEPIAPSARSSPALSGMCTLRQMSSTNQWSPRKISPIIEDRVEAFNRLSIAKLDGMADSTVERAMQKITDMGFTEAQAKHALKTTDMGDGLRVDRAVDLLLRAR